MPSINKTIYLVGSASGIAASSTGCGDGPEVLQKSPYLNSLSDYGVKLQWQAMVKPPTVYSSESILPLVIKHNQVLAETVANILQKKHFFTVFGGDHSCAIGTWSGAASVVSKHGDLGLIWIDAHMDSHTPETSMTGNIHGMPLACLLGYGNSDLINILTSSPKLKPEHVCVIGARSFEQGEEALLKLLNVRVFCMDEVYCRGLEAVMAEALSIVNKGTVGYGVTVDLDSIDPIEAPGTGVCEPDGLHAKELCAALRMVADDHRLLGIEIVEFDPHHDRNQMTEKLVGQLMAAMILGKLV